MTWCGRSVVISALLAAGAVGRLAAQAPPGATLPPIGSRVRVTLPRAPDDPRRPGIPLPSARVEGTLLRADTTGLALRILGRFERDYPAAQVLAPGGTAPGPVQWGGTPRGLRARGHPGGRGGRRAVHGVRHPEP